MTLSRKTICGLALWIAGWAFAQTVPSKGPAFSAEPAAALKAIREYALNYIQRLPDYTCNQVTRRNSVPVRLTFGGPRPHSDVIDEQVSFVDHTEIHKVTKVNGASVSNVEHDELSGGVSRGEFGNLLEIIFDPRTATEFQFDRLATLNGRRVYVFEFRVPQSRGYRLSEPKRAIQVPYKGTAYADYQTKAVMRIEIRCIDIPASSEFKSLTLTLDYKPVRVAGQEFILPSHYLLRFTNAGIDATNEAEFTAYRRFSADATIKFDDAEIQ